MLQHYQLTIQQCLTFLRQLSDADYITCPANFTSGIGSHIRHIVDHFHAVKQGTKTGVINYEMRTRGCELETNKALAEQHLLVIEQWLQPLTSDTLALPVNVVNDVGIGEPCVITVASSVNRELMFVCSHAVHHYAIIALIHQSIGGQYNNSLFGIAPSTANNTPKPCAH